MTEKVDPRSTRMLRIAYVGNLVFAFVFLGLTVVNCISYFVYSDKGFMGNLNLGLFSGLLIIFTVGCYISKRDYEKRKIQQMSAEEKSDDITS
jgi:hypothetical protein